MTKLIVFDFEGQLLPVKFEETQTVKEGVECDIYSFIGDTSKDLAIVRVGRGHKTPLQCILKGEKTIEGFVSGKGVLTVRSNDKMKTRSFQDDSQGRAVIVEVGQIMQWEADDGIDLVFSEVCYPPYADGRFEDLPE